MIELKRVVTVFLAIIWLLSLSSLNGSRFFALAEPRTWVVGTVDEERPVDFTSIQAAIDNASSGDTVQVYSGNYREKIEISKSIFLVGEDRDLTIISNDAADSLISIRADKVTVKNFTIRKTIMGASGIGIQILSGYNVISQNKILGIQDGILIYSYSSNTISDNIVSFNTNTGVSIYFSSGNFLSNNLISDNYQGISISFSGNNVFSENTVSNNSVGVIIFPNSNNNVFYHNNFLDNASPASTTGSVNVWDSGGEGNYWSAYRGHDDGKDGIGDTAYSIDVANRDNKPLMGMFYSFPAAFAHESFFVTIISNSSVTDFRFETGVETGNQIISFNVDGEDGTTGFSRIGIPVRLMNYSLILVGGEETSPYAVDKPDKSYKYLYFTYAQSLQTVTIISSKTINMYNELLDKYNMTQTDLQNLNETYLDLLNNYTDFLNEYSQLQQNYNALNSSYYAHLLDYDQNLENMRNLMYIFAAATAVLIVTTIYLSKRAHTRSTEKGEGGK